MTIYIRRRKRPPEPVLLPTPTCRHRAGQARSPDLHAIILEMTRGWKWRGDRFDK